MLCNIAADPAADLTRLHTHSLEDQIKSLSVSLQTGAHPCEDPWSSVITSDFISQVPRITAAGRHPMLTQGKTAGGGKDTNKTKQKENGKW